MIASSRLRSLWVRSGMARGEHKGTGLPRAAATRADFAGDLRRARSGHSDAQGDSVCFRPDL